jgi:DNA-binding NarL/FixJ family response regulator
MPGISGAELVRKLKVALPSLAVVLVSGFVGEGLWCDIADSGADAFLVKPLVLTQCLATLRFVVMEKPSKQQSAEANESPARLNNREAAVMKSLAAGMFYKEIADCFHWSLAQVKKFQHSAYVKLGAHTRSDAVRRFEGTDG